eukprot:TRINITY_DN3182_c1_g1_i1.p1 TRINITY_DN3182_c1_g1~~TRINITY_DN3182_c1_g1_i1.p1  ORF type:complete len:653 (+),score=120.86 TRINITY_DN3182_c1_g1_i1:261-2219(+)
MEGFDFDSNGGGDEDSFLMPPFASEAPLSFTNTDFMFPSSTVSLDASSSVPPLQSAAPLQQPQQAPPSALSPLSYHSPSTHSPHSHSISHPHSPHSAHSLPLQHQQRTPAHLTHSTSSTGSPNPANFDIQMGGSSHHERERASATAPLSLKRKVRSPDRAGTPHRLTQTLLSFTTSNAQQIINNLQEFYKTLDRELANVRKEIQTAPTPIPKANGDLMLQFLNQVSADLERRHEHLKLVESQVLLPPTLLAVLWDSKLIMERQRAQVSIYQAEMQHFMDPSTAQVPRFFGKLLVTKSPFLLPVKQNLVVSPINVEVLTGGHGGDVVGKATVACINKRILNPTKKSKVFSSNDTVSFEKNSATYAELKFNVGTGCKIITLQVQGQVHVGTPFGLQSFPVTSEPTEHAIVITHTKQWIEAQGALLRHKLFSGEESGDVSLKKFCNYVQWYYLIITGQNPHSPLRTLTPEDFKYIVGNDFGEDLSLPRRMDEESFDNYWAWLGPVLKKLHFNRVFLSMWTRGLLWGMVSKSDAQTLLRGFSLGVFLLRFSLDNPGECSIVYNWDPERCRHYLIKTSDLSETTLPQFLRDNHSTLKFLQLTTAPDSFARTVLVVAKGEVLDKIGHKRRKPLQGGLELGKYDSKVYDLASDFNDFGI